MDNPKDCQVCANQDKPLFSGPCRYCDYDTKSNFEPIKELL